jgi:hypothetical protein
MERALMLRRRRCSDWRARFFADLMLAKVELRNAVLGLEKDANYAGDSAVRQLNAGHGRVIVEPRPWPCRQDARILPAPGCQLGAGRCQTTRRARLARVPPSAQHKAISGA